MSKGELAPAEALNTGRVRVRGDLSVLVAAQQMLNAARAGRSRWGPRPATELVVDSSPVALPDGAWQRGAGRHPRRQTAWKY